MGQEDAATAYGPTTSWRSRRRRPSSAARGLEVLGLDLVDVVEAQVDGEVTEQEHLGERGEGSISSFWGSSMLASGGLGVHGRCSGASASSISVLLSAGGRRGMGFVPVAAKKNYQTSASVDTTRCERSETARRAAGRGSWHARASQCLWLPDFDVDVVMLRAALLKVFGEVLRFLSVYMNSLEESIPKMSSERLALERGARCAIVDLVSCPASESMERRETTAVWVRHLWSAGFSLVPFG